MTVVVIAPPAPILTLEECKAQLNVHHDDDNALIARMARGAERHLAAPAGWLGRSLGVQTLELRLDGFGSEPIRLPYPPLIEVLSVAYVDRDGADQTIGANFYRQVGDPFAVPLLVPAFGETWPAARCDRESVRIRYTAGYAALPDDIRDALLMLVAHRYRNREAVADTAKVLLPLAVDDLLAPHRIW